MKILKGIKNLSDYSGHKYVFEISRPEVGLKGFVAIHNNKFGAAVGGTRIYPYKDEKAALSDVLRLSHAMTYKCALVGVRYGGGKGVIIADPAKAKTPEFLQAYAEAINDLDGLFYTGEDVGLSEEDVSFMLKFSNFFIGKPDLAGDPSPYAALSTFYSIQAAAGKIFGSENLEGKVVAIKGVGKVGGELLRLLTEVGAKSVITDVDKERLAELKEKFPDVKIVDPKNIHAQEVDIYSPCALGSDLNHDNITAVKAKIICGAANNQLSDPEIGDYLFDKKIVYIPDYVANSGGLIDVVDELDKNGYDKTRVLQRIKDIKNRVKDIIDMSLEKKLSPNRVADQLAQDILDKA